MASYRNQIFATLSICIISVSHGIIASWTFPNFLMLSSTKSPFNIFSISPENDSMLETFYSVGSVIGGCIITGIVTQLWGRKWILFSMGIPHVVYWLLILFVENDESLYAQRVLAGFTTGCILMTVTATITEISSQKIRGNLGTFFATSQNLGLLIGSVAVTYIENSLSIYIFMAVPVLFMLLMVGFPETPHQLLLKGKEDKAIQSIRFYKNLQTETDQELLNDIINKMKNSYSETGQSRTLSCADFRTKKFCKTFFQSLVIMTFYLGNGSYVVINIVSNVCLKLHSTPEIGSIILCSTHLGASIFANLLSHLYQRKYCLVISSFLGGLILSCVAILSVYYEKMQINVAFIILLNLAEFILQVGMNSLTHLVVAELLPLKTKNITLAIIYGLSSFIALGFTKAYPLLLFSSDTGVLIALFVCGSLCFMATCFYLCGLSETRKKFIG